ncbi:chemotaxis protein CheW [Geomonas sp. RF6]|uniref:chemotaxis protein CheW n=1 Tax=Geomonas sp. RF6 TaxID=2897342 RepID=UPI001E4E0447|nr:chemotaxis protein CheW [Geomonas sp. RF6]UFS69417.1 chemotaxis protein CheW [Geomonas sp. RF6]
MMRMKTGIAEDLSGNLPMEKLFILHLDDRRYALKLAAVERVVRMVEITPLPSSRTVLGLMNLQGRIIPVLDLRPRFGMPARPTGAGDVLVVAASAGKTVALVADSAGEIVERSASEPLPAPEFFPGMEYVTGVLKSGDRLVLLCDLDHILSAEERGLIAEVESRPEEEGALPPPGGDPAEDGALRGVLKERARRLALEPPEQIVPEDQLEVVHFTLASERYGIESVHVREVYPYKELVPLPGSPDFLLGIMNVRGKIHSVLDMRRFFHLPGKGSHLLSKVIILQSPRMVFGIVADAILGVASVPLAELQPGLLTFTGARAAYVKGVTRDGVTLLDGEKILSDRKLVVHMEV